MRKRDIAKKVVVTFFRVLFEVIDKSFLVLSEILGGLLKTVGLILGLLYAPEATGDVVAAKNRRAQRKRIDELESKVEELEKSK